MEIVIQAYKAKRDYLANNVKLLEEELASLRKNAKDRPALERNLSSVKSLLELTEKSLADSIAALDNWQEFLVVDKQISELCEKRNKLIPSQLIQAQIKGAIRNGFCQV